MVTYDSVINQIARFYPSKEGGKEIQLENHEGLRLLNELCHKKMEGNLGDLWKSTAMRVMTNDTEISKIDVDTPFFYPSYVAKFLLSKQKKDNVTFKREIWLYSSVIAPYFTFFGVDSVTKKIDDTLTLSFDPILTISPMGIYEKYFPLVRVSLESTYKEHRFVPLLLLRHRISSAIVPASILKCSENPSVFQALFAPEDVTCNKFIGSVSYS